MPCPNCGQQALANNRFCSRCGSALDSIKNLHGDDPHKQRDGLTAYQKGIRQGFQLVLLSLILVPAYILLAALFPANDVLVESAPSDTVFEKVSQAVLATVFMLGLARIAYSYLFERSRAEDPPDQINPGSGKLLFSSSATSIETDKVKTAELVDPGDPIEQRFDRTNGR